MLSSAKPIVIHVLDLADHVSVYKNPCYPPARPLWIQAFPQAAIDLNRMIFMIKNALSTEVADPNKRSNKRSI